MIQKEGPGWRFAEDSLRDKFSFLIGGDGWAFELTTDEFFRLSKIIFKLLDEHQQIANQLMREESISLEMESTPWWVGLSGDKDSWSLRIILQYPASEERGFEASWPSSSARQMVEQMRICWDSSE